MADILNLGDARSRRSGSADDWTPVEALRWLLAEIEAGRKSPVKLYVTMVETKPDVDDEVDSFVTAGTVSKYETIGMLAAHLTKASL